MRSKGIAGIVLSALLLAGALGAPAYGATEPIGKLLGSASAGNVDGLAGDEIVTVHRVAADPGSIDYTVELAVRRGRDGQVLWSREFPTGSLTVVPARVGENGARGMYVVVRRYNYFVDVSTTADGVSIGTPLPLLYGGNESGYDIYALTAAGDPLWEEHITYAPDQANPGRSLDAPLGLAFADATPSAATDVALVLADAPTVVTQANRGETTVRVVVLDGASGAEAATASLGQVDFAGVSLDVADFDDDGLDDIVVDLPGDRVTAVRGADGASLWSFAGSFNAIAVAADLSGDTVPEVLASNRVFGTPALPSTQQVLNGRSGAPLFDFEAEVAWPTATGVAGATEVTTADAAGYELDFYDAAGVNRRHRDAFVPTGGRPATVDISMSLGDLDGDGTQDRSFSVTLSGAGEPVTATEVIDGATFDPLWADAPIGRPVHRGRTGAGDDLVLVEPFGEYAVDISLQDGATGASQWLAHLVPVAKETYSTQVESGDFDADGAADLLVTLNSRQAAPAGTIPDDLGDQTNLVTFTYVLDGGNGATIWSR